MRRAWEVLEQGRARELRLRLVQGGSEAVSPAETEALARLGVVQRRLREEELSRDDRQQLLAQAAGAEAEYERARQQASAAAPRPGRASRCRPSRRTRSSSSTRSRAGACWCSAIGAARSAHVSSRPGRSRRTCACCARPSPIPGRLRLPSRARLGDLLLGPELEDAPDGRLLVVPDGVLHRVPFAALETADGALVSGRFVLSQAPSLGVWQRAARAAARDRLPHARGDGEHPLHGRTRGASRACRRPPGRRARSRGARATRSCCWRRPRPRSRACRSSSSRRCHFASHVEIDEEHPERSRIVMAVGAGDDDGYLQAREIERMRLPCRLVVVSGCRSGQGRILDGEGVVGLSHALHGAGVRSLVMSLWDVTDEGAAEAMARFYELVPGRTVGEALRETQAALRGSSRFAHPAHWAAFFVSGDADQRLDLGRPAPSRWLLALVFGLPVAVLAAVLARRRGSTSAAAPGAGPAGV